MLARTRYRSHRFRAATMAFVIEEVVLMVRAMRDAKKTQAWWLYEDREAA